MPALPIALLPCWLLLLVAGCLLSAQDRAEWRQEWISELWHRWHRFRTRDEWNVSAAFEVYSSAVGCFPDAWCLATSDEERWTSVRTLSRTPAFCLALLSLALLLTGVASRDFRATRAILTTLPYASGSRIALVSRTGRLAGIRKGIPAPLAGWWLQDGRLVEDMALCLVANGVNTQLGQHLYKATYLQASANLLNVIGQPVPADVEGQIASGSPVAMLSYSFWQHQLRSDPKVLGTWLRYSNNSVFVAGILPQGFWLISSGIDIYELGSTAASREGILVVRARPGVSAAQLEEELTKVADRHDTPFTQTAPQALFVSDALHTPVWFFGSALFIAAILVMVGHGTRLRRSDRGGIRLPAGNWRWWSFLVLKTAMALMLVFTVGMEIFVGVNRQVSIEPLGGPALLWFYTAACSAVLVAIVADQQARCRVCLRCLAFAIRVGCPGCLFLDWSGTELLCPDGHGVLYVPHHISCWDESERWVALET